MVLLAGCAPVPPERPSVSPQQTKAASVAPLPATYIADPECPGCLAVTLTLRADGTYLVRDQLGASQFHDFGRWRVNGNTLELAGGRDARRYPMQRLRRAAQVEALRGPFRLVGVYDGETFTECRTGVAWRLSDTRAADALNQEYTKLVEKPALVALDAQLEGAPETLRVFRPPTLLNSRMCPS